MSKVDKNGDTEDCDKSDTEIGDMCDTENSYICDTDVVTIVSYYCDLCHTIVTCVTLL